MSNSNPPEIENVLNELQEYIETRKISLEEEIQENLHQAVANSKDSLELIRENIEPKVDAIIQAKMNYLDNKMENWKKEFRIVAQEEVEGKVNGWTRNLLEKLDDIMNEKKTLLEKELRKILIDDVKKEIEPQLTAIREENQVNHKRLLIALGLSSLAFATSIITMMP